MWRLGRIEEIIPSSDNKMRVKVISKGGQVKIIRRPVQHIYPLEVRTDPQETQHTNVSDRPIENVVVRACSTRKAALQAKDRITECLIEDDELINWLTVYMCGTVPCSTGGVYGIYWLTMHIITITSPLITISICTYIWWLSQSHVLSVPHVFMRTKVK